MFYRYKHRTALLVWNAAGFEYHTKLSHIFSLKCKDYSQRFCSRFCRALKYLLFPGGQNNFEYFRLDFFHNCNWFSISNIMKANCSWVSKQTHHLLVNGLFLCFSLMKYESVQNKVTAHVIPLLPSLACQKKCCHIWTC